MNAATNNTQTNGPARRRNKSGEIGTKAETPIARHLTHNGWPSAERRRLKGRDDQGDITGTPGIAWSIKGGNAARNASDEQVRKWLERTEEIRTNAQADIGVLILQRRGVGPANADRWWAIITAATYIYLIDHSTHWDQLEAQVADAPLRLTLADLVRLLRATGWGNPLETGAVSA